jgi:hypothetical protein
MTAIWRALGEVDGSQRAQGFEGWAASPACFRHVELPAGETMIVAQA